MDFIEYHWIYQRSHAVQLRLYVVIHTIIELSLLQLIFRISLFVIVVVVSLSITTSIPSRTGNFAWSLMSVGLDAYLVSAFVRYLITSDQAESRNQNNFQTHLDLKW